MIHQPKYTQNFFIWRHYDVILINVKTVENRGGGGDGKFIFDRNIFRNIWFSSSLLQMFLRMNSKTWKNKFGIKKKNCFFKYWGAPIFEQLPYPR